jgi:hypothetical protein
MLKIEGDWQDAVKKVNPEKETRARLAEIIQRDIISQLYEWSLAGLKKHRSAIGKAEGTPCLSGLVPLCS